MKFKLNTDLVPLFTGTYENIWEVSETNDEGEELAVDYKHEDLMKSIVEVYKSQEDYILSELGCSFIKKISFLDSFYSPREYNFSTDSLDFEIEVDKGELLKVLASLKDNQEFSQFLQENYTSYDGFISFTPNTYDSLRAEILEGLSHQDQAVGALITYLAKDTIKPENGWGVEVEVHDHWRGNGYMSLDYDICEHKYKDWGCIDKNCFNYQPEVKTVTV